MIIGGVKSIWIQHIGADGKLDISICIYLFMLRSGSHIVKAMLQCCFSLALQLTVDPYGFCSELELG